MIHALSHLAALITMIPVPSPDLQQLNYITNQVEWFYGEMFIGMTVLYGFIAAIFGYFIPRHNLRALHERIDRASADAKDATDAARNQIAAAECKVAASERLIQNLEAGITDESKKQETLVIGVTHLAMAMVHWDGARRNLDSTTNSSEDPASVPIINSLLLTQSFEDACTAVKQFAQADNEKLFGIALDLAAAILSRDGEKLDKHNLKAQCMDIVILHDKQVNERKMTAHPKIGRFNNWISTHPND